MVAVIGGTVLLVVVLMFSGKGKSREEKKYSPLIKFLEEADDAYIHAHQVQQIQPFTQYASYCVCNKILDSIRSNEPKLFGTETYRERTWRVLSEVDGTVTVLKELTHKHVKIKRGVQVAIGEDMKERWTIALDNRNNFKVVEILFIVSTTLSGRLE